MGRGKEKEKRERQRQRVQLALSLHRGCFRICSNFQQSSPSSQVHSSQEGSTVRYRPHMYMKCLYRYPSHQGSLWTSQDSLTSILQWEAPTPSFYLACPMCQPYFMVWTFSLPTLPPFLSSSTGINPLPCLPLTWYLLPKELSWHKSLKPPTNKLLHTPMGERTCMRMHTHG